MAGCALGRDTAWRLLVALSRAGVADRRLRQHRLARLGFHGSRSRTTARSAPCHALCAIALISPRPWTRTSLCVLRLNEKRGLACPGCGRINDISAAVTIAGRDK